MVPAGLPTWINLKELSVGNATGGRGFTEISILQCLFQLNDAFFSGKIESCF
jgi:hypothetical protein